MKIRIASIEDFDELYAIGKATPELRVSTTEDFMAPDEFKWHITNPRGVFLVAEEAGKIAGFICANARDVELPVNDKYACIVYLVVLPEFREHGVGGALYAECEKRLRALGIITVYAWASTKSDKIVDLLRKQGFGEGSTCVWMDKRL